MGFTSYTGKVAVEKLSCAAFQKQWQDLYDSCDWATPYQGISFSEIWFDVYQATFEPVFFLEESETELESLLILGKNRSTGQLVHVGGHQAEYQCWLSRSSQVTGFVDEALKEAFKVGEGSVITFRYLPPTLLKLVSEKPGVLSTRYSLSLEKKPVVDFNTSPEPWQAMKKKGNKSKLSRLRKHGDLTLELLDFQGPTAKEDATKLLKQVETFYDFRQAAINDSLPFASDENKFLFYLSLLTSTKEFQALVITQNEKLIACIIGPLSSQDLSVGVFCFDFFMSKHSPGKLLILLGAELLASKGVQAIDLTPGGDWKWRYANSSEEVAYISFYESQQLYARHVLSSKSIGGIKKLLLAVGVRPSYFSRIRTLLKKVSLKGLFRKLASLRLFEKEKEYRVYSLSLDEIRKLSSSNEMKCNHTDDFLKFQPSESWHSKQNFISSCLKRFEAGEMGYSFSDATHLLHSGWLAPLQKKSFFSEVGKEFIYPEPGAVLFDFYTHPSARGQGLYQKSLKQMLLDAAELPGIEKVYISVLADNGASRHVIEKVGFEYLTSVYGK